MEELHNQTPEYNNTGPTVILDHFYNIALIVHCLIFTVALPVISMAIYGLLSQVETNYVAPVYVINLLISDLIQISARMILGVLRKMHLLKDMFTFKLIYMFGVGLNICFMVCISAERYAMIAHPVRYRNMRNMRTSVFVSVAVCILSVTLTTTSIYLLEVVLVVLLLPYPLVVFFFMGTWKALSRTSVPRNDQRQIMAILGLVLCIYTILFLPYIVWLIIVDIKLSSVNIDHTSSLKWRMFCGILVALNPLFDSLLYVLMRKDAKYIFSALFCCFYKRREENTDPTNVTEAQV